MECKKLDFFSFTNILVYVSNLYQRLARALLQKKLGKKQQLEYELGKSKLNKIINVKKEVGNVGIFKNKSHNNLSRKIA